ncbi:tripartite-type tricarboxylate transporter receptor subunit TctC [Rhizobium petrolearium]|uniref:Bug family tripartite tricarboxylate transporter substrate binding protein n=1 Tax=Neorhizobium petrolearium TaxID=515361 RepID=UPI001AE2CDDA|nr:tripartite tricarboxylate transporter substrate binding protein [Neorhizobium petrolearium]MBP1845760.1 tripartite-type tricarboxylate transporter receptor subunit TctC [Neorhizobium petrolearium]
MNQGFPLSGASTRRSILAAGAAFAIGITAFLPSLAQADDYPSKPITLYIGYGPGGQTDVVGRGVAKVLADQLGVPINVVNKPGAGGALAASQLKKEAPDGYTAMFHTNSVVDADPFMSARINFKPDDFDYAGMVTAFQQGLAAPKDAPYDSIQEYVAWAKKNPGSVFGSLSPLSKMYIDQIAKREGLDVNVMPLASGSEMINALLGKQAALVLSGGIHYRYPEETKTIVATTTFRHVSAPDVGTIDEAGYGLGIDARTTLILPKGTPRDILGKLSTALKATETDEEFKAIVSAADIPIMYMDLDQAAAEIAKNYAKNKAIFEKAGIVPQ